MNEMNEVSPVTSRNLIFGPWPLLEGQLAACLRPFRPCCWLSGCHVMGVLHGKHMWPTLGRRAQQNGSTFKQKKNFVQRVPESCAVALCAMGCLSTCNDVETATGSSSFLDWKQAPISKHDGHSGHLQEQHLKSNTAPGCGRSNSGRTFGKHRAWDSEVLALFSIV